ncbi:MAG: hypothetical protein ACREIU_16285 [Planctomycetota bacterium]
MLPSPVIPSTLWIQSAFGLASAGLLAGCASSSTRLHEGERCRVTLRDRRTQSAFHLVNEAYGPREAYYSRRRDDAATKVLVGDSMQILLDRLEEEGFGGFATAGESDAGPAGGSYALTVERGGIARSVRRMASDPEDRAAAIVRMVADFREFYDGTNALQTVVNPEGPDYFERVKQNLDATNRRSDKPQGS